MKIIGKLVTPTSTTTIPTTMTTTSQEMSLTITNSYSSLPSESIMNKSTSQEVIQPTNHNEQKQFEENPIKETNKHKSIANELLSQEVIQPTTHNEQRQSNKYLIKGKINTF